MKSSGWLIQGGEDLFLGDRDRLGTCHAMVPVGDLLGQPLLHRGHRFGHQLFPALPDVGEMAWHQFPDRIGQHAAHLALAVRQVVELLGQLANGGQLGLGDMKPLEALEGPEVLRRLS